MNKLESIIGNRISTYIGFDVGVLFNCGDLVIFGGSVRDSIANMQINDIDILCGSNTANRLHTFLTKEGYLYNEKLTCRDIQNLYKDIKVINEPRTYIKNDRIIQVIIRPVVNNDQTLTNSIENLINNVDLSCCAVSYDGNKLIENYKNAINHCLHKIYKVNKHTLMYSYVRAEMRKEKLNRRGWKEFMDEAEEIELVRESSLNKLLEEDG